MAFVNAPAINAAKPKEEPLTPVHTAIAAPHKILPMSIDRISEQYIYPFFLGNARCSIPEAVPYAASSNAIHTAVGNIGGIPRATERSRGEINPTARPQGQPHINPHISTGMCIGQSIAPIWGICPVKKGNM